MARVFRTDWFTGETVVRHEGLRVFIDGKLCSAVIERETSLPFISHGGRQEQIKVYVEPQHVPQVSAEWYWKSAVGKAFEEAIEQAVIAGRTD